MPFSFHLLLINYSPFRIAIPLGDGRAWLDLMKSESDLARVHVSAQETTTLQASHFTANGMPAWAGLVDGNRT